MSVLVINTTGNQRNFENKFCSDLLAMINTQTKLIDIRGENLLDMKLIDNNEHEVIVIVSHAGRNGSLNTNLDCGFEWDALDNPTVFAQLLGNNKKKFILMYCACEGLLPETIVSGVEDKNCTGVIVSRNPVKDTHITIVADVVNLVHEFIIKNDVDTISLQKKYSKIS